MCIHLYLYIILYMYMKPPKQRSHIKRTRFSGKAFIAERASDGKCAREMNRNLGMCNQRHCS